MFKKSDPQIDDLNQIIDRLQTELQVVEITSPEFSTVSDQLTALYDIRNNDTKSKPDGLSADTLLTVVGNLAGIAMIVEYERAHVVASKALNLILKLR